MVKATRVRGSSNKRKKVRKGTGRGAISALWCCWSDMWLAGELRELGHKGAESHLKKGVWTLSCRQREP